MCPAHKSDHRWRLEVESGLVCTSKPPLQRASEPDSSTATVFVDVFAEVHPIRACAQLLPLGVKQGSTYVMASYQRWLESSKRQFDAISRYPSYRKVSKTIV